MAYNIIDSLQIKIENAKAKLPEVTVRAIDAVPWREAIMTLRERHGYTFEQLGDLELETELLLVGLLPPEEYPKELKTRMGISGIEASKILDEMDNLVFRKIREELIKNTEQSKILIKKIESVPVKTETREPVLEKTPEPKVGDIHPMLAQKMSGSFEIKPVKTEHTLGNLSSVDKPISVPPTSNIPKIDPYREIPE